MLYPTSNDDIIDSREVIDAIEELEAELDALPASGTEADEEERADIVDQLAPLKELAEEGEDLEDWSDGVTLIRDSYFVDYAMELADDLGAIDANASWPTNHIDWDAAANELQMDYMSVWFDGIIYWGR